MQGISLSGKNFRTGKAFDEGLVSDFDIAVSQSSLFKKAKNLGIIKGDRSNLFR